MGNLLTQTELDGWAGLVRAGQAVPVLPTTDTGYKSYGPGRLFLPAGTNYCTNPSFETDTGGDGLSDALTADDNVSGTPTYSRVAGRTGGYAQHVAYTPSSDVNRYARLSIAHTAVGSFAAGDIVTCSFHIKGTTTGTAPKVGLNAYNSGDVYIASVYGPTEHTAPIEGDWIRVSATTTALPAGTSRIGVELTVYAIHDGDTVSISYDDVLIEKSAVLTPYFDGSYPGCVWTGTANASTSTRTVSALRVPFVTAGPVTIAYRMVPLWGSTFGPQAPVAEIASAWRIVSNGTSAWTAATIDAAWRNSGDPSLGAWSAGTSHALVGRVGSGMQALTMDGVAGAKGTYAGLPAASTAFDVTPQKGLYIGPLAMCPTAVTDAETATLSAMLTAGATGLELFRFFQRGGYRDTLILPLQGDSVGYKVV